MLLIAASTALAIGMLAYAFAMVYAHGKWDVALHPFVAYVVFAVFALGMAGSAMAAQDEQKKIVELHEELVQLLKLVDAKQDSVLSADVRSAIAQMINRVNTHVARAKQGNDGLLDIWFSDALAASEPLR